MTTSGEMPQQAEHMMNPEEISEFRELVLWPSVQWLDRGFDFMRDSPTGSEFEISKVVVANYKFGVSLGAYINAVYEEDTQEFSDTPIRVVQLVTEFIDHDLLEGTIEAAKSSGVYLDEYEEQYLLAVWRITEYDIDDTDDPVRTHVRHELRGYDQVVLWTDDFANNTRDSNDEDDYVILTEKDYIITDLLEDDIDSQIKFQDLEYIKFVLYNLGVPEEIIYPDSEVNS